jgi:hypothetical protein
MILVKWLKYSGTPSDLTGPGCAPNLLIEFIGMFFLKTSAKNDCEVLYNGQLGLQRFLVIMSVLCIPVMLFVIPTLAYIRHKKKSERGIRLESDRLPGDLGHVNTIDNERRPSGVSIDLEGVGSGMARVDIHETLSDIHHEENVR